MWTRMASGRWFDFAPGTMRISITPLLCRIEIRETRIARIYFSDGVNDGTADFGYVIGGYDKGRCENDRAASDP